MSIDESQQPLAVFSCPDVPTIEPYLPGCVIEKDEDVAISFSHANRFPVSGSYVYLER